VAAGAGFDEDLRRVGGGSYWLRSARAAAATILREGHRQLLDLGHIGLDALLKK